MRASFGCLSRDKHRYDTSSSKTCAALADPIRLCWTGGERCWLKMTDLRFLYYHPRHFILFSLSALTGFHYKNFPT